MRVSSLRKLCSRCLVGSEQRAAVRRRSTQCAGDTLAAGDVRLAKSGGTAISRIAQHGPHHRALPTGAVLAGGDAVGIKPPRNLPDAEPVNRVHLVNRLNHPSFFVIYLIQSRRLVSLADIPVSVRRTAQHTDFTCSSAIAFATPRAF